ncbi:MAG: ABC transporter permease subunit, partial [Albidovulum sp.]
MTVVPDAPKDGFRPSMLIYDTRYRSITIQIVVLLLFMAGAAWLVDNTIKNLQTLGKDFSFDFLWYRAGYDINQTLIPYTNDSTHGRALFVGLLNTILVSVMGCVAATIIGVMVGVLRLSQNWLVARIMTLYVEVFRNVPLLLWILVALAVFTDITPAPNQFRVTEQMIAEGKEPEATMKLFDSVAITNRGTYVPAPEVARSLGSFDVFGVPISLNVLAFI